MSNPNLCRLVNNRSALARVSGFFISIPLPFSDKEVSYKAMIPMSNPYLVLSQDPQIQISQGGKGHAKSLFR